MCEADFFFLLLLLLRESGVAAWKQTLVELMEQRVLVSEHVFIPAVEAHSMPRGPHGFIPPASTSLLRGGCPHTFTTRVEKDRRLIVVAERYIEMFGEAGASIKRL